MTPRELLALIREKEVRAVDLRFMDFPGLWLHFTIPAESLTEEVFEDGWSFDASTIRGLQNVNASDMLVVPVPDTAFIDPFCRETTLTLICNILDPYTKEDHTHDPRNIARKALNYMKSTGIADSVTIAPELEFYVFDDVRYDQNIYSGYYFLDSREGSWTTGRSENPNLGYKLRSREGYFPLPPADSLHDARNEMMLTMLQCGLKIEGHYHAGGAGGQGEIDLLPDDMVKAGDNVLKFKYVVKNVARKYSRSATFMPKPLFQENGSGMPVQMALWKDSKNLFAGNRYAGLSDLGEYAMGGLLRHAPALCALTNPTTNSYKRLVPGSEAPVNLAYSRQNRTAAIRVPVYSPNPKAKCIEFRTPDGSSNPYLTFAAMLMAALDGIKNKVPPGQPFDKPIYDLQPEELARVPKTPDSLEDALRHLERDHEFLLQGSVFTPEVIQTWIAYKREKEVEAMRIRPHPYEFALYFDI